ncbi:hypothetical protein [Streptomyces sp. NPDC002853]
MEIVQNIGRALQLNEAGYTKMARVIVPVFLEPNEAPTNMVASASFRPLVARCLVSTAFARLLNVACRAVGLPWISDPTP